MKVSKVSPVHSYIALDKLAPQAAIHLILHYIQEFDDLSHALCLGFQTVQC